LEKFLPVPDLIVRYMKEEDLDQVQEIDRQSFHLPWPGPAFRYELMENTASLCFVAETADSNGPRKVVGLLVAWMILDEVHIATIAVRPGYRQQGVGHELVKAALRAGVDRGAVSSALEVRAGNLPAQALYRDFGFDVVGRRPGYYKDNSEDALLMSLYDLDESYFAWLDGDSFYTSNSAASAETSSSAASAETSSSAAENGRPSSRDEIARDEQEVDSGR
jgi:[ribosomal protein S18]-alanine N-acetyltransferase